MGSPRKLGWPQKLFVVVLTTFLACASAKAQSAKEKDLLEAGRVDEAIADLQAKIKTAPDDAELYNLLCRSYFALGSWDRGVSACEKAVALQPDNSRYHLWLGRAYGEKASNSNFMSAAMLAKKVRSEFETAVQLSSSSVDARTDLAEFYLEAPGIVGGGQDKAVAQAHTLARLDPAKAHWVIARIAQKNHDPAAAEKEYRAAVEASHGSANAWINLAFFYRHQERFEDMEDAINHAASAQMNTPEVLMEAAETLIDTGRNFPFAVALLQRYLSNSMVEQAPAFKAHYLLGTVLEKMGDKQAAAQEYRTSLSLARNFSRAQEALDRLNR
jgi:tetratricopeptide (TPR) repeat protein